MDLIGVCESVASTSQLGFPSEITQNDFILGHGGRGAEITATAAILRSGQRSLPPHQGRTLDQRGPRSLAQLAEQRRPLGDPVITDLIGG